MTPAEYFKLRLEHTLQHTQQSTRLNYLVNGAVLAMVYFVAKLEDFEYAKITIVIAIEILAFVNLMHAGLIKRQGVWYAIFAQELAKHLTANVEIPKPAGIPWVGTHNIYALLHAGLAITLFVAGILVARSEWP